MKNDMSSVFRVNLYNNECIIISAIKSCFLENNSRKFYLPRHFLVSYNFAEVETNTPRSYVMVCIRFDFSGIVHVTSLRSLTSNVQHRFEQCVRTSVKPDPAG